MSDIKKPNAGGPNDGLKAFGDAFIKSFQPSRGPGLTKCTITRAQLDEALKKGPP